MYKSYDITFEFCDNARNIKENVLPLISPTHDIDNVDMEYLLKKLEIEPKEGIEIYGEEVNYTDELNFSIDIKKKEDEMPALDFIHEIYKALCKKCSILAIDLRIGVTAFERR